MLRLENLHTYYGLSHILFDVSMEVNAGEIVCLLGRNGAGKSTTIRSIIGLTPPKSGVVEYKGTDITREKTHLRVRRGIAYVPDDRRVFADLTVDENLQISARETQNGNHWDAERVYRFFPALREIKTRRSGHLSGGEQQMLTIGRALMTNPDLLLLDEPTEGLAPLVVKLLAEQIAKLRDTGLTVLLAEQNQEVSLQLSNRVYIIDNGSIKYTGSVDDLRANEAIRRKFLCI
ncbi:MAG: ABC transporter ATP-binding protein [Desulfobacteraceae bacterium]|nr:ABC transporter ATP-binding protein [Desulfobacteraceae bacterium]